MSLECPQMAVEAITRLREKGLEPTLDHISAIIFLARKIQEPEYRTFPWLSHHGVQIGESSRRLRPFTIKSGTWYDHVSARFLTGEQSVYACALAMEYGHDADYDFTEIWDMKSAKSAIAEYIKHMEFTKSELEDAIDRIMPVMLEGDRMRAEKNSAPISRESMVARLVAMSGQPEEYWWSKTLEFASEVMIHSLSAKAAIVGVPDGEGDSEYQLDNYNFQCELIRIERELKEQHESD